MDGSLVCGGLVGEDDGSLVCGGTTGNIVGLDVGFCSGSIILQS